MQTIRLQIAKNSYKLLMKYLSRFDKEELQIIHEDNEFLAVQDYLQKELLNIEQGKADFISLNQLEADLEETIQKHEA